jgi:hypothetical protein
MSRRLAGLVAGLIFLSLSSCDGYATGVSIKRADSLATSADKYVLPDADLRELRMRGMEGDPAAALAVAEHYANVNSTSGREAGFWWQIAAENGEADGMQMHGVRLWREGGREKCARAVFWLKRAITVRKDARFVQLVEGTIGEITSDARTCK